VSLPGSRTAPRPGDSPRSTTIAEQRVRRVRTEDLGPPEIAAIRELLWAAFPPGDEGFTEDDWDHAVGGTHVVLELDGRVAAHASVVERTLHVGDRPLRTGYVEAVAAEPERQRRGLGTLVMAEIGSIIRDAYELGALGTGVHPFYERLGWITWRGPTALRTVDGPLRTPDEDGFIMVLPTPTSPVLDLDATISCDWRPGDVW
jgi:aminoglycoside 2'-N-acetyltransferase I